jgi:ATP-binding cassette subfamily F protein 3
MTVSMYNIEKEFGERLLFRCERCSIAPGDKVGIIGPNGSGKTTLLRMLTGLDEDYGGTIEMPRGARFCFIDAVPVAPDRSAREIVAEPFERLRSQDAHIRELERLLSSAPATDEGLERLAKEMLQFEVQGGYDYVVSMNKALSSLGFAQSDLDRPSATMSAGEVSRLRLSRLVSDVQDIWLLDEPTNYLDIPGIQWLERQLKGLEATVIVASHDAWFLDQVCNKLLVIEHGTLRMFSGNYSDFKRVEQAETADRADHDARLRREIERMRQYVEKYRYGTRASQAASREKAMERLKQQVRPTSSVARKRVHLRLHADGESGTIALRLRHIDKSYDGRPILRNCTLTVHSHQHIAVVGRNGAGKSTLLGIAMGQVAPDHGDVYWGPSVRYAFFPQTYSVFGDETAMEWISARRPQLTVSEAKSLLGTYGFSADQMEQQTLGMSSGEKQRLLLALLSTESANMLVLDEPTNFLDIQTRQALAATLVSFEGTILVVAHDRTFIDAVADRILYIDDADAVLMDGNYSTNRQALFTERSSGPKRSAAPPAAARTSRVSHTRLDAMRQRVQDLEAAIAAIDDEQTALTTRFQAEGPSMPPEEMNRLSVHIHELTERRERLFDQLSAAEEELLQASPP